MSHVLSVIVEQLLFKGHTESLVHLLKSVEFEWDTAMHREVANYADSLAVLMHGSGWRMELRDAELVSLPTSESKVDESDME